jgi:hypothetical protein
MIKKQLFNFILFRQASRKDLKYFNATYAMAKALQEYGRLKALNYYCYLF